MPTSLDEDLLAPTLTEEDDTLGIDRPWNPWSLVILTFFAGMVGVTGLAAGGSLLALNFERLGWKKRALPVMLVVLALCAALAAWYAWVIDAGLAPKVDQEAQGIIRWTVRGFACLAAAALAGAQRKRYRLAQASDLPEGKLLLPGFLAVVGGAALELGLLFFFLLLFGF